MTRITSRLSLALKRSPKSVTIVIRIQRIREIFFIMEKIVFQGTVEDLRIERRRQDDFPGMQECHFHEHYELYYLVSGERQYFIQDRSYRVQAGDLVLVNSNQIHKAFHCADDAHTSHERILVEISSGVFEAFGNFFPDIDFRSFFAEHFGVFHLDKDERREVERLLYSMTQEMKKGEVGASALVRMKLMELLTLLVRMQNNTMQEDAAPEDPKRQKVQEVARFLSENYSAPLQLEEIASCAYVNKYYLCHIFKEVTGLTLREYLNLCRIRQAQKLLRESSRSVTEISEEIGYDSVNYFGKVFKEYMGITPLQYRRLGFV